MKRFLLFLLIIASTFSKAQNLYDIRWTSEGVEFYGFMLYFAEDDVFMRTGYYGEDGQYNVVHSEYQYVLDEETGEVLTMVSISDEYVQNNSGYGWDAFHLFWYVDETTEEWVGPYIISNSHLMAGEYDYIIEPTYTEVDMSWLDEEYLNFFFFSDEDDYKILLAAGKDASSSQNTTSYTNNSNSTGTNTTTQNNSNNTTGNNTTNTNTGNNTSTTNSTSTTSQPVKIHLLIVANTLISDIGTSTLVDVNNIVSEVTGISEVLGVSMNKMLISDKQFTKKNVENFLVGFSPGPNDVVIFMYSGHGYRFSNQTEKYPQLDMRYSEYQAMDDNSTMNLKQVYDELIKKGARLNIVLGDCCNSNVGFSRSVGSSFMASRSSVDPDFEKLKKLFIKSSGNIIAAGASPSEYSWCTMNNGGFFTTSFIGSLREEISKFKPEDNPDWGDILTNTTTGTRKKSDMCTECKPQNVVYDKYMKN